MPPKYPNDDDGNVLRELANLGNDMSRPMVFEFHVAAATETIAQQVAARAAKLGYRPELSFDDGSDDDPEEEPLPPWTCECIKEMVPEYKSVVAAQAELDKMARRLGAYVDGWGSFGNVDETT